VIACPLCSCALAPAQEKTPLCKGGLPARKATGEEAGRVLGVVAAWVLVAVLTATIPTVGGELAPGTTSGEILLSCLALSALRSMPASDAVAGRRTATLTGRGLDTVTGSVTGGCGYTSVEMDIWARACGYVYTLPFISMYCTLELTAALTVASTVCGSSMAATALAARASEGRCSCHAAFLEAG